MLLENTATKDFLFIVDEKKPNQGEMVCRKCGKKVKVFIKIWHFLFFAGSKMHVDGKWCEHSDIDVNLREIVEETLGVEAEGAY